MKQVHLDNCCGSTKKSKQTARGLEQCLLQKLMAVTNCYRLLHFFNSDEQKIIALELPFILSIHLIQYNWNPNKKEMKKGNLIWDDWFDGLCLWKKEKNQRGHGSPSFTSHKSQLDAIFETSMIIIIIIIIYIFPIW